MPLLPVYIQGSHEAWPPGVALPRPRPIRVIFGRAHSWEELKERGLKVVPEASDYDAISLGLRQEVLRLKRYWRLSRFSCFQDNSIKERPPTAATGKPGKKYGKSVAEQIMAAHLVSGDLVPGAEVALKIDQTLTQDITGTLAYLEFEAMGVERARPEVAVSYVDHNLLQTDFRNADDHRFLRTLAARYGLYFSPPGNGISHQVHLERFSVPGKTLLGSDSHTPTGGGAGMLALGAGGMDVALALAGQPYYLVMPEILGVRLSGRFPAWVSAKDVILELLRRLTVKGGRGKILEFFGPALPHLSVPERAAITNMGAELGATTSIFPADAQTRRFMALQGRDADFRPLKALGRPDYAGIEEVDLNQLAPLSPPIRGGGA